MTSCKIHAVHTTAAEEEAIKNGRAAVVHVLGRFAKANHIEDLQGLHLTITESPEEALDTPSFAVCIAMHSAGLKGYGHTVDEAIASLAAATDATSKRRTAQTLMEQAQALIKEADQIDGLVDWDAAFREISCTRFGSRLLSTINNPFCGTTSELAKHIGAGTWDYPERAHHVSKGLRRLAPCLRVVFGYKKENREGISYHTLTPINWAMIASRKAKQNNTPDAREEGGAE